MYIKPLGERALILYIGETISEEVVDRVHLFYDAIRAKKLPYILDIVPGYRTLTIHYNPLEISYNSLVEILEKSIVLGSSKKRSGRSIQIPVLYGGEYGPDLEYVAKYHNISKDDVIRYHTEREYLVYMLGFSPGFAYMGELSLEIQTPRLKVPRKRVAPGSIGIAKRQTGIYAVSSPGGWQIIGRTYLNLFDPKRDPITLLNPGDRVRFYPITEKEFLKHVLRERKTDSPTIENPILEILNPGPLSIVVDKGRYGYRDIGLSESGAMDQRSYILSNLLLGNKEDAPSIEITYSGFTAKALRDLLISLVGGDFEVSINGKIFHSNNKFYLRVGDILKIERRISGARLYLSLPCGIDAPKVLRSASLDIKGGIGGIYGRPLRKGDLIPGKISSNLGFSLKRYHIKRNNPISLRFIPGPDLDHFTEDAIMKISNEIYEITRDIDRMGYRLKGPKIAHGGKGPDIVSEGTVPGTIQIPGNGMPIVLAQDAQPLGGYAKIGVVIRPDLDKLAQAIPGDKVKFIPITLTQAIDIIKKESLNNFITDDRAIYKVRVRGKTYNVEIEEIK